MRKPDNVAARFQTCKDESGKVPLETNPYEWTGIADPGEDCKAKADQ